MVFHMLSWGYAKLYLHPMGVEHRAKHSVKVPQSASSLYTAMQTRDGSQAALRFRLLFSDDHFPQTRAVWRCDDVKAA